MNRHLQDFLTNLEAYNAAKAAGENTFEFEVRLDRAFDEAVLDAVSRNLRG